MAGPIPPVAALQDPGQRLAVQPGAVIGDLQRQSVVRLAERYCHRRAPPGMADRVLQQAVDHAPERALVRDHQRRLSALGQAMAVERHSRRLRRRRRASGNVDLAHAQVGAGVARGAGGLQILGQPNQPPGGGDDIGGVGDGLGRLQHGRAAADALGEADHRRQRRTQVVGGVDQSRAGRGRQTGLSRLAAIRSAARSAAPQAENAASTRTRSPPRWRHRLIRKRRCPAEVLS